MSLSSRGEAEEATQAREGFLCPACPGVVQLESEQLLREHWDMLHANVRLQSTSKKAPEIVNAAQRAAHKAKRHAFEDISLSHPKTCDFCPSIIWKNARQCRKCKFTCHKRCSKSVAISPDFVCLGREQKRQRTNILFQSLRKSVTGSKRRYVSSHFDLDLTYMTPNLIAMSFPASGLEATYRNNLKDVAALLGQKHGEDNYMVFNVSGKSYDISRLNNMVLDFGWPDHLAPPLERLCSIVKSMGAWLKQDPKHCAVVHCKGGKGRTGVVICAYMSYIRWFASAADSMQQFAIKRFERGDESSTGITQPSQRRYVEYFQQILDESRKVYSRAVVLKNIIFQEIPNYSSGGGCRIFFKIGMDIENTDNAVIVTEPHTVSESKRFVEFPLNRGEDEIFLRDDVIILCYHRTSTGRDIPVFRYQFHTFFVTEKVQVVEKKALDEAWKDEKHIPESFQVVFEFDHVDEFDTDTPSLSAVDSLLAHRPPPLADTDDKEKEKETMEAPDQYESRTSLPLPAPLPRSASDTTLRTLPARDWAMRSRNSVHDMLDINIDEHMVLFTPHKEDGQEGEMFRDPFAMPSPDFSRRRSSVTSEASWTGVAQPKPASPAGSASPRRPSSSRLTPVRVAPEVPVSMETPEFIPDMSKSPADAATEFFDLIRRNSSTSLSSTVSQSIDTGSPRPERAGSASKQWRLSSSSHDLAPPDRSHESEHCFYGKMSDAGTARLLLEKGQENDFLLRQRDDQLLLSISTGTDVRNVPLEWDPARKAWIMYSCTASTVMQLTQFFQHRVLPETQSDKVPRCLGRAMNMEVMLSRQQSSGTAPLRMLTPSDAARKKAASLSSQEDPTEGRVSVIAMGKSRIVSTYQPLDEDSEGDG